MSQHDMSIANQGFPAFRADLNDALPALASNNSGATEPSTMFAHQWWVDTSANPSVLKQRNADNDAWITFGTINQTGDTFSLVAESATISGGTANGVTYLNGSKVLTSGSALTFDGSAVALNTSTTSDALRIAQTGTGNAFVVEDSTSPDSTPFVIDATGTVINGHTTGITGYSDRGVAQQVLQGGGQINAMYSTSVASPAIYEAARSRSATVGSHTVVQDNDWLGYWVASGSDGTQFIRAAAIVAQVDGTPGTNDMPGRLVFSTTADGGSSPTERLRIDSAGNVGIGTSSPASFGKLTVTGASGAGGVNAWIQNTSDATGDNVKYAGIQFSVGSDNGSTAIRSYRTNSANNFASALAFFTKGADAGATIVTERARIDSGGAFILTGSTAQKATGTTWSNPSDVRLKNNVRDYAKGTAELMQIRVREWEYNGKCGTVEGTKGLGVVADEAMLVLPETVDTYEAKLNADDEEATAIKKFDATEITWLLVKTAQEQQALIASLTARLDAANL